MSEHGMSKMENNEIMNTNMEDIKMRSVEDMVRFGVERMNMTKEEERAFVKYWFDEYEKAGFLDTFHGVYAGMGKYNGKAFTVLGRCEEGKLWDLECLPAWRIKFDDGVEADAYPEEICVLEQEG